MEIHVQRPKGSLRLLIFLALAAVTLAAPSVVDLAERNVARQATFTSTTIPFQTPVATTACPTPCGWNGQLCCADGRACYTDTNNQAQCGEAPVQTSVSCPFWTTSTETLFTTFSTTVEYIVTYTSTESGVVTVIRTASWRINPQPTDCCSPPAIPACNSAVGEIQCGNICCAAGQYCQSVGNCVVIIGGDTTTGHWEYSTTTYIATDLQTVTTVYSTYVAPTTTAVAPA